MKTNETQKLNEVQISTDIKNPSSLYSTTKYIVRVSIPGTSFITEHSYSTATEAGNGIFGLKEFYKHFKI